MTLTFDEVPFSELHRSLGASHDGESVMRDVLPWLRFLPEFEFNVFVEDLVDTAEAAAAIDNLTPISTLLVQWRHTAELYADPEMLTRVTNEPVEDLGQVPMPAQPGIDGMARRISGTHE